MTPQHVEVELPLLLVGKTGVNTTFDYIRLQLFSQTSAMVNHCCAFGCKNYVGKKPGLSFYRFPLVDKARCVIECCSATKSLASHRVFTDLQ